MEYLLKLPLVGSTLWGEWLLWFPACFVVLALCALLWHRRWWRDVRMVVIVVSLAASILICACRISLHLVDASCSGQGKLPSELLDFEYGTNSTAADGSAKLLTKLSRKLHSGKDEESKLNLYLVFEEEMLRPSRHRCKGVLDAKLPPAMRYEELPDKVQHALSLFAEAPDAGNALSAREKKLIHLSLMEYCRDRILQHAYDYYCPRLNDSRDMFLNLSWIVALLAVIVVMAAARCNIQRVLPYNYFGPRREL